MTCLDSTYRFADQKPYSFVYMVFAISEPEINNDQMLRKIVSNSYIVGADVTTQVQNPSCVPSVCANQCRHLYCAGFNFRNLKNLKRSCLCEMIIQQTLLWDQYDHETELGSSVWQLVI